MHFDTEHPYIHKFKIQYPTMPFYRTHMESTEFPSLVSSMNLLR